MLYRPRFVLPAVLVAATLLAAERADAQRNPGGRGPSHGGGGVRRGTHAGAWYSELGSSRRRGISHNRGTRVGIIVAPYAYVDPLYSYASPYYYGRSYYSYRGPYASRRAYYLYGDDYAPEGAGDSAAIAPAVVTRVSAEGDSLILEGVTATIVRVTWRAGGAGSVREVRLFLADSARAPVAAQTLRAAPFTALFEPTPAAAFVGVTLLRPDGTSTTTLLPYRAPAREYRPRGDW
jgi:hypothetical protein